jgi:hypothetical protein
MSFIARLFTFWLRFRGRAGYLKALPNAIGSYHMSIAVEFTADGVENLP